MLRHLYTIVPLRAFAAAILTEQTLGRQALKALEQEFAGKVKCVFNDPPYNTGSAFEQCDDGLEHSLWLSLMRDRLELLLRLLSDDGSI